MLDISIYSESEFEPGAAGWESLMLPLSYTAFLLPPLPVYLVMNKLLYSTVLLSKGVTQVNVFGVY